VVNKFNISAVLCAAGTSSRMPDHNKLLLEYRGTYIVKHIVQQLLGSNIHELIVVTGYEATQVEDVLVDFQDDITFVNNPKYLSGHTSTIQTGVQQASTSTDAFMICLADMPLLTDQHYIELMNHYIQIHELSTICRPHVNGQPGHPVIFDKSLKDEILACEDKEGCRGVIKDHRSSLRLYEIEDHAYLVDIDTPNQYQEL